MKYARTHQRAHAPLFISSTQVIIYQVILTLYHVLYGWVFQCLRCVASKRNDSDWQREN